MKKTILTLVTFVSIMIVACQKDDITNVSPSEKSPLKSAKTNAESIVISASTLKQKIDIMGGDMERSANFLSSSTNSSEIINWFFKDINMPFWRVMIDKNQELTEGTPNMAYYDKQVAVMKSIKVANPNIKFWATLKTDYDGYGTANNMPNWCYAGAGYNGGSYSPSLFYPLKWARFCADYLKHMKDQGVSISYISISKEWTQVTTAANEAATIIEIKRLLATSAYSGVTVPKFYSPAGWGVTGTTTFVNAVNTGGLKANFDAMCSHWYDGATTAKWTTLVAAGTAIGKKTYNDETGSGGGADDMSSASTLYGQKCDMYAGGVSGELIFELWSRGVTSEVRSVYFTSGTAGVRKKSYYLIKDYINNIYNKNYVASTLSSGISTDLKTMAFSNGSSMIVIVVNTSSTVSHNNVPLTISGKTISSTSIARKSWYTGSDITGFVSTVAKTATNKFNVSMGPDAIAYYTFNIQ